MDNHIIMSQKEIRRYDIIQKIISKELNETDASKLLALSTRQIRRLKKEVKKKEQKG